MSNTKKASVSWRVSLPGVSNEGLGQVLGSALGRTQSVVGGWHMLDFSSKQELPDNGRLVPVAIASDAGTHVTVAYGFCLHGEAGPTWIGVTGRPLRNVRAWHKFDPAAVRELVLGKSGSTNGANGTNGTT